MQSLKAKCRNCTCLTIVFVVVLVSSLLLENIVIGSRFPMLYEGLAHCHVQASLTE